MRRISLYAAVLAFTASFASAQMTAVGPFVGSDSEGFESTPRTIFLPCLNYRPFNNKADLCTPGNSGTLTTSGWSFQCSIPRRSGSLMYGSAGGYTEITFDNPVGKFGGYFGSNSGNPDATVEFFDNAGAMIGSFTATIPADCSWNWNGWAVTSGTLIKSVSITGTHSSGGFVLMDDLEIDVSCPAPVTYCTAGTTTGGCNATMGSTGIPSLSNAAPFTLTVSGVDGNKNGIVFYSVTGRNAAPWGNSQSILCIKSPTQRMNPPANSGGTVGACDGAYATDWNAYLAANPLKPINRNLMVGNVIGAQSWFRDGGTTGPVGAKGTATSNALEFTICP